MFECKKQFCSLCGNSGTLSEILKLNNFPKAAQFFPDKGQFGEDQSVNLELMECSSCGLVQLANDPVTYYKDVITAASLTGESRKTLKTEFEQILDQFKLRSTKVLEIGAGKGDFVGLLKELDVQASGLEHNSHNVKYASEKGLEIKPGYLLDMVFDEANYDFVIVNNFLEHQPDIKGFLKKINGLLANEGLIYISVPNLQRILDKACFYEFVVDHLVYFSKNTLRKALEINGFEIKKLYLKNNDNDIVAIAQKTSPMDLSNKIKEMRSVVGSITGLVEDIVKNGKRVSVWGAGHRALALMAIAKINQIDFVIDSAPFKQGKYTPILHKKIISPDDFFSLEVCDYLIVMLPGALSEQVEIYLKQKEFKGNVIYFNDSILQVEI